MNILQRSQLERLYTLADTLMRSSRTEAKSASIGAAILVASRGSLISEAPREAELWAAEEGNPQKLQIPFDHLMRDLTAAYSSSGGYLTSTDTELLVLPLVGAGVVRAGANVITNARHNTTNPHINTKPTFGWLSTESSQLSNDSSLVLGEMTMSFKRGASMSVQAVSLASKVTWILYSHDS